ncbi:hypothetical protein ACIPUD_37655 [Bradyrhizobium sp. CAR08]
MKQYGPLALRALAKQEQRAIASNEKGDMRRWVQLSVSWDSGWLRLIRIGQASRRSTALGENRELI